VSDDDGADSDLAMNQQVQRNGMSDGGRVIVAIATPLEPALVARIEDVDDLLDVRYQPDLLPPPRYPCDHRGSESFHRTEDQNDRWRTMLMEAEVLFGVPGDSPQGLADVVQASSALRWVQGTAAGAGQVVREAGLNDDALGRVTVTSASGVHAGPLAEFAMFGLLAFTREMPRLLADTKARRWEHYPVGELAGRTLVVVGLGAIGRQVARLGAAFGMRVLGVNRTGKASVDGVEDVHPTSSLLELLSVAEALVITLPLTEETKDLLDAEAISRLPAGAVVVNVGRGGVIDERALVDALQDGRLAGAALDVFATEPLPQDSPLWRMSNVLVSPHTAALSVRENERIVDLFAENLRRYLHGEGLLNRVDPTLFY
jgi:glyoxylate/hydroxypyruvate reductase